MIWGVKMKQTKSAGNLKRPVTSRDVAERAQVSQATVSRVFSGQGYTRPDTAERVREAARALGYTPNAIARSLNSKQTDLIAVVSVHFENPFYQDITTRLSEMIEAMGKQMLLIQSPFEAELDDILYRVLQYRVDAVVVLSAAISSRTMDRFTQVNIPMVIFNKQFDSRSFYSVCSDNVDAGRMVAEYLWDRGYRSFGYLSGDLLRQTSENRCHGYLEGLRAKGCAECALANGDYSYRSGQAALLELYERGGGRLPRAIFCANDLMAFGAMDAARFRLHLRVPEDVAFVGVDDLPQSGWESYRLTSVTQPIDEMTEYTQTYLKKRLEQDETSGGMVLLKCRLVERAST